MGWNRLQPAYLIDASRAGNRLGNLASLLYIWGLGRSVATVCPLIPKEDETGILSLPATKSERPVCLVTGGARRIGAAIVEYLAPRFDIAIHYGGSATEADDVMHRIEAAGARTQLFQADLASEAETVGLLHSAVAAMGRLDLVVSSASVFDYDTPSDFAADRMRDTLCVNLVAPMLLAREFARIGSPQATMIHMIDNKVFSLNPDFFSYSLSKVALKGAVDMLAMHFRKRLRVCGIAPGVTLRSGDQSEENFERSWRHTLTGEGPTPRDIGAAVEFIWETRSLNGEIIVLDGGQRLMSLERDVAFAVEGR